MKSLQVNRKEPLQHQVFYCLPEAEAARFLRCSRALLRKWRTKGGGPPFIRLGQRLVRYRTGDLEGWLNGQQRQ